MMNNYEDIDNLKNDNSTNISFHILFALQFLLLIANSIINIKIGAVTLVLMLLATVIILIKYNDRNANWKSSRNAMLGIFSIWGIYYFLELANPNNVQAAWNISLTHYLVYPIICAILVPLTIRNLKDIEYLLFIWSVFTLIATFKGYWQKNYGFNERESYFLYTLGGASTHIIWSGIRYFSIFSDAANYGAHSAMSATVFGISALFIRPFWKKVYFIFIAACAIYGLFISGTRSAIAIPFGGLFLFILISKSKKLFLLSTGVAIGTFIFFSYTNIGDSNSYIRKMRSAFHPTKDLSYQVRVGNRKQMSVIMKTKPFGFGAGLAKGERFNPPAQMPFPPDSWLVTVWVEMGIVGLMLYLLLHGILFVWCSWILMFKVKSQQLRGLIAAWLCTNAGFFVAAYANDVMQYPNSIPLYIGFALCFAAPQIDRSIQKTKNNKINKKKETLIGYKNL